VHVAHLSLADYRCYAALELPLDPGVTSFVGPNGQGKTNLVEAIGYVATLSSHRVASDAPLVRHGAERAVHRADVVRLLAQALCLEEMTGVPVPEGAIFYAETKRRVVVPFDAELRRLTEETAGAFAAVFASGITPPPTTRVPVGQKACPFPD